MTPTNEKPSSPLLGPEEILKIQLESLKTHYPELEDQDVSFDYGQKEIMMMNLQTKLSKTREELNSLLNELPPNDV
jgi:hypothetical protein